MTTTDPTPQHQLDALMQVSKDVARHDAQIGSLVEEARTTNESIATLARTVDKGFQQLRDSKAIPWGVLASWMGVFTTASLAIIAAFVTLINLNTRQMIDNAEDKAKSAIESVSRDVQEDRDAIKQHTEILDDIRKDRFTGAEGDALRNRITALETAHNIRHPGDLPNQ